LAPTKEGVLVVTPHPDDAEFGVAGSVAHWVSEGREVVYVVCTNGDKGSPHPDTDPGELIRIREEEQMQAASLLGVSKVHFLRYPDQGLEDTPSFRKDLVRLIRNYRPYTVVTSDPYRKYIWHRDHRITGQVVLDAVFPYARDYLSFPDLWKHEGLEPHKVREVLLWGAEQPNCFLDITDTFSLKLKALQCHRSQVGDKELNVKQFLEERARQAAWEEEFSLAESFYQVEVKW